MDQAHKEQVSALSELSQHKGWKYIVTFATQQAEMAMNKAGSDGIDSAIICRSIGEIRGLKKILTFVSSSVEQNKNV